MSQAPLLTTSAEVADLACSLSKHSVIAVDLEGDSMHSYQEKVCLLQFSWGGETALVDPVAGADLSPLQAPLGDPDICKIFHAADYDIRCLARDFSIKIDGLFDTMIAAQLLGEPRWGWGMFCTNISRSRWINSISVRIGQKGRCLRPCFTTPLKTRATSKI